MSYGNEQILKITASVGYSTLTENEDKTKLIKLVDNAKKRGRNYEPEI